MFIGLNIIILMYVDCEFYKTDVQLCYEIFVTFNNERIFDVYNNIYLCVSHRTIDRIHDKIFD